MEKDFKTPPILLIAFNSPETTKKVFEAIKIAKPKKLFISVDGPRNEKEKEKVEEVKKIISKVDWNCKVKKRIFDENQGIIKGAGGAIDWFFDNVKEGIVFDDDCVPDQSFFRFCAEMLEKYRDDVRIMHISGDNFQKRRSKSKFSYYFSKYTYMWGWASWSRAWKENDAQMKNYFKLKHSNYFSKQIPNLIERNYLKRLFREAYKDPKRIDSKWLFTVFVKRGLTIAPNKNLVQNIGFYSGSTNTKDIDSFLSTPSKSLEFPLKHPLKVKLNRTADKNYAIWLFKHRLKKHFLLKTGLYKFFTVFSKHKK